MRLAAAGHAVHFLARSDYDHCRKNGMSLTSPLGDVRLEQPRIFRSPAEMPPCDYVLIATKSTSNADLPALLPPWVCSAKAVVVLQNGLGVEAKVASAASAFGTPPPIVGGLCFVCSNRVAPGNFNHSDYGLVCLGEHRADGAAAGITPALKGVGELFALGTNVPVELKEDLLLARWEKVREEAGPASTTSESASAASPPLAYESALDLAGCGRFQESSLLSVGIVT